MPQQSNSHSQQRESDWRRLQPNLGMLAALVMGCAFSVGAFVFVSDWIDDRVADRLDARLTTIEYRLESMERRISRLERDRRNEAMTTFCWRPTPRPNLLETSL